MILIVFQKLLAIPLLENVGRIYGLLFYSTNSSKPLQKDTCETNLKTNFKHKSESKFISIAKKHSKRVL